MRTNKAEKRRGESGAAIVEFGIVLLPTLGFLFLLLNLAWIIFEWACVQEAVREGVRSAITCSPSAGLNAFVDQIVEQYSFGFINSSNVGNVVSINYYAPGTLSPVNGPVTTGDVVVVSVSGLKVSTFAGIMYTPQALYISANSADIMSCSSPASP